MTLYCLTDSRTAGGEGDGGRVVPGPRQCLRTRRPSAKPPLCGGVGNPVQAAPEKETTLGSVDTRRETSMDGDVSQADDCWLREDTREMKPWR